MATFTITSEKAATTLAGIRKLFNEDKYNGACIAVADLVEDDKEYKRILAQADSLYPTIFNEFLKDKRRKQK